MGYVVRVRYQSDLMHDVIRTHERGKTALRNSLPNNGRAMARGTNYCSQRGPADKIFTKRRVLPY